MLIGGEDGAHVVEYLREQLEASAQRGGRPYSVNTLKTYVSLTKSKVLEADYRNRGAYSMWSFHGLVGLRGACFASDGCETNAQVPSNWAVLPVWANGPLGPTRNAQTNRRFMCGLGALVRGVGQRCSEGNRDRRVCVG